MTGMKKTSYVPNKNNLHLSLAGPNVMTESSPAQPMPPTPEAPQLLNAQATHSSDSTASASCLQARQAKELREFFTRSLTCVSTSDRLFYVFLSQPPCQTSA
ncbi:unnamed protein product [Litomosoides sigmodontis]|uniref:Uncharacterized protein n=1 Tax=Litomosoides sigmodontis TaxID=42156 RepID=A0A3P6SF03_LITSI|nr:unnamed protein product [Litomosoides sigmodontis]